MDIKEQIKLREWAADMAEKNASGLSIRQWCEMKGISTNSFLYRCKRVRDAMQKIEDAKPSTELVMSNAAPADIQFVKIEASPATSTESDPCPGIEIRLHDMEIHIHPDAKPSHVRLVMETLRNA